MKRRAFIFGGAASAGLTICSQSEAAIQCQPFQPGVQACSVGIPSFAFQPGAQTQFADQWCWAASLSMVFSYFGHPVSQARIVAETWGGVANLPGLPGQILADLNRQWVDDLGRPFRVTGDVLSANAMTAIQDLTQGVPLIVGTLGHCMVLTSMSYLQDLNGQFQVQSAVVRDPWPFSPGIRTLTAQEYLSTNFLARLRVF